MNLLDTALVRPVSMLVASLAFLTLAACTPVADQKIEASSTVSAPGAARAGHATVYIGRPAGFRTSVFPLPIEVDGRALTSLSPGHYTTVELPTGPHKVGSPDEYWTRVISGVPHPAEFVVESGKTYYLLPTRWGVDAGTRYALVGPAVVPHRTAVAHASFSVQVTKASAPPPTEFAQLTYAKSQCARR